MRWVRQFDTWNERRPVLSGLVTGLASYLPLVAITSLRPGSGNPWVASMVGAAVIGVITIAGGLGRPRYKRQTSGMSGKD
jgi:hypothetical protein